MIEGKNEIKLWIWPVISSVYDFWVLDEMKTSVDVNDRTI
jgi:hypothetical protein